MQRSSVSWLCWDAPNNFPNASVCCPSTQNGGDRWHERCVSRWHDKGTDIGGAFNEGSACGDVAQGVAVRMHCNDEVGAGIRCCKLGSAGAKHHRELARREWGCWRKVTSRADLHLIASG